MILCLGLGGEGGEGQGGGRGGGVIGGLGVYRLMRHFFHSSKVCETDMDGNNPSQTSHVGGWMLQWGVGGNALKH